MGSFGDSEENICIFGFVCGWMVAKMMVVEMMVAKIKQEVGRETGDEN